MAIGGFFKAAPDQLAETDRPSETSKSIVADMIASYKEEIEAKKKAAMAEK